MGYHDARVALIFKKGDVADCANYRPISLLPVGYKLFASVLLQRLKDAGAESSLWKTQFGFRSKHGTLDAIFLARRLSEHANVVTDQSLALVALDRAKAFDSICPDKLCTSLERFGLPSKILDAVRGIYSNRRFSVSDAGCTSDMHDQAFWICQGCPLSPFLFGMLVTVLITDARNLLAQSGVDLSSSLGISELLYADDTLLVQTDAAVAQKYMDCVQQAGRVYGLALNWDKVEVLSISCHSDLTDPAGKSLKQTQRMIYLGSVLCSDGSSGSEISRRIGSAKGDFDKLTKAWNHAGISRTRKLAIFDSCVLSKLLYNMHSLCLNTSEARRVDAFHVRCLRKILKIPPSFYSRVSNTTVLEQAGANTASSALLERQLIWMGKLALRNDDDALRQSIFQARADRKAPKLPEGRRRRGRPRKCWAQQVFQHAVKAVGGANMLSNLWQHNPASKRAWIQHVRQYCHG